MTSESAPPRYAAFDLMCPAGGAESGRRRGRTGRGDGGGLNRFGATAAVGATAHGGGPRASIWPSSGTVCSGGGVFVWGGRHGCGGDSGVDAPAAAEASPGGGANAGVSSLTGPTLTSDSCVTGGAGSRGFCVCATDVSPGGTSSAGAAGAAGATVAPEAAASPIEGGDFACGIAGGPSGLGPELALEVVVIEAAGASVGRCGAVFAGTAAAAYFGRQVGAVLVIFEVAYAAGAMCATSVTS